MTEWALMLRLILLPKVEANASVDGSASVRPYAAATIATTADGHCHVSPAFDLDIVAPRDFGSPAVKALPPAAEAHSR